MHTKMYLMLLAFTLLISCQKEENANITEEEALILPEEAGSYGEPIVTVGDMILTEKQLEIIKEFQEFSSKGEIDTRGATSSLFAKWPNCVVSYKFDSNNPLRSNLQERVIDWMNDVEDNSNIEFRYAAHMAPRSTYVLTEPGSGSAATIGYGSSAPTLQLLDQPNTNVRLDRVARDFEIKHELGHVVGLIHEHQRSDRNSFINVDYDNIDCFNPYNSNNFNKLFLRYWPLPSNNSQPFNIQSIMMYASCACADTGSGLLGTCNSGNAVLSLLSGGTWGNRLNYQTSDYAAIDALYTGCSYSGGGGGGPTVPIGGPIQ